MMNAPESDPTSPIVSIRDLHVVYGSMLAVNGVSFDIPRGSIFGFIGPNGAGKTSTIKVLATLLKPTTGQVTVCGLDVVKQQGKVRRRIGYMPDDFGVYEDLTASEYLHFFAAAYLLPADQRGKLVADVLALTDLEGKADSSVDDLSKGMKQRLGVARLLLHDPDFLLLDEPANGLDPRARIELRELLRELQAMGKTILISSHILHELAQFCSHMAIVEAGKLVAAGQLSDIYKAMGLDRSIHVGLSVGASLATWGEKFRLVPGVASVEELPDRLVLRQREGEPEAVLPLLLATGAPIRMFQPDAVDLETAFMRLTEGKTA